MKDVPAFGRGRPHRAIGETGMNHMARISIGDGINQGIDMGKKEPVFHIVSVLIVAIAMNLTAGILMGPLLIGYFRAIAKQERGEKPQIDDLWSNFSKDVVPGIIIGVVQCYVAGIGFMFCIVPGLIVLAVCFTAYHIYLNGENEPGKALTRAWESIKTDIPGSAIAVFVFLLVGLVGALLCGIGLLVTLPIMYCANYKLGKAYAQGA